MIFNIYRKLNFGANTHLFLVVIGIIGLVFIITLPIKIYLVRNKSQRKIKPL